MKTILSGVQATGKMHIGNYLGAMKPWVDWQNQGRAFFFIPDLHTLNVRPDAETLRGNIYDTVAWLLAVGIDPRKSTIFVQSRVPAHAELCWILQNYVTMGELNRMTQYKDKSSKRGADGQVVALYTYPVLMAADILLYSADIVPVGEDQKQHVELTRDIATRMNNIYGDCFVVPEPALPQVGARVMSLTTPTIKMSKSDANQNGNIMLADEPKVITKKIKRAVTDSGSTIELSDDKPAIANLLQVYAGFSDMSVPEVANKYAGVGYGTFKTELAELVVEQISQLQMDYEVIRQDKKRLDDVIEEGSQRAAGIAQKKLNGIKQKIGLT
ncbi:tryptophan--tRNA ligase [bacterium]|nr:tryptophan--tRNA ligase [bacterium]